MKFYITTPIYYVNAKPHIGHAYTTVIADILARVNRLRGRETFFLTGLDEHGEKIAQKAREAGQEPQEFCDAIAKDFQATWKNLNISNDDFIRTTGELHKKGVKEILKQLHDQKDIYLKDYEGLYCSGCEKFLTEKDLVDGICPDHKKAPELIKEKNYFFKLSKYLKAVEEKIRNNELVIEPENRRKEVLGLFKQGMDDFSISRQSVKWGIDVPFDESQKVYVWADALTNYLTALGYGEAAPKAEADSGAAEENSLGEDAKDAKILGMNAPKVKRFWPPEVQLIGKEILKFHAIFWPAMLLALKIPLPKRLFVHGFFTINGEKMSKTIGNVIDPNDLVEKWGVDAARYLIVSQFPFGGDEGDISLERMQAQYEAELANDLGNLLQRTLVMMEKYKVPPVECEGNPYNQETHKQFASRCPNAYRFENKEFLECLDRLEITKALAIVKEIISGGNKYIEKEKPWELAKENQERCEYVLQGLYNRLYLIALLIEPFMPGVSKEMKRQMKGMDPKPIFKK